MHALLDSIVVSVERRCQIGRSSVPIEGVLFVDEPEFGLMEICTELIF